VGNARSERGVRTRTTCVPLLSLSSLSSLLPTKLPPLPQLPLPALLSRTLSTLQHSSISLTELARLHALLDLIDLRLRLAGSGGREEALRGVEEIEREWGAILALQKEEMEGRAWEVLGRCRVVAAGGDGALSKPFSSFLPHPFFCRSKDVALMVAALYECTDVRLPAAVEAFEAALSGLFPFSSFFTVFFLRSFGTHLHSLLPITVFSPPRYIGLTFHPPRQLPRAPHTPPSSPP
jgi:hypothetical protein